jgi:hypothetical protein
VRVWPWLVGGLGVFAWSRHRAHETPLAPSGCWVWPLPRWNGRAPEISDGFGIRKGGVMHKGVDLMYARAAGDSAKGSAHFVMPDAMHAIAAGDGVVWSAAKTPRGNAVVITHGATWSTFYQHLEKLLVSKGERVRAGQPVGIVGADPLDGEHLKHLHFELWTGLVRANAIDPAPYLAAWSRTTLAWSPPALVASNPAPRNGSMSAYRPVGDRGEPYPEWVRALRGQAGVYVIRDADTHECLYVGSSSTQLYDTLTRHFQTWRRWKGFWKGQYGEGADPGLTYPRGDVEVAVRLTSPSAALDAEMSLIARLRPRDNQIGQPDAAADEPIPF